MTQGGSASFGLAVTLLSGSPQIVNLTASGFPSGVSYSFTNPGGTPSFTSTINVFTTVNTPGGTYPITITGTTGLGLTHTATPTPILTITELPRDFNLSSPVTRSCSRAEFENLHDHNPTVDWLLQRKRHSGQHILTVRPAYGNLHTVHRHPTAEWRYHPGLHGDNRAQEYSRHLPANGNWNKLHSITYPSIGDHGPRFSMPHRNRYLRIGTCPPSTVPKRLPRPTNHEHIRRIKLHDRLQRLVLFLQPVRSRV